MASPHTMRPREALISGALFLAALISVVSTFAIIVVLVVESLPFFRHVNAAQFLFGTRWAPLLEPRSFGVLPLIVGTLHIVIGSAVIGLPLGLGTAIFLSEYSGERARAIIKPLLEILAGIPTVVFGFFALTFITPLLQRFIPDLQVFNSLSAAIVVGIMILPMVATLCEDSLRAVPRAMREGGYSLGATKFEVTTQIVVPGALSGVLASFILAISRAIGETMAVTLAAGSSPRITADMTQSIQTMTAFIVQVSLGDTPRGTIEYQSIFAVGLLLFAITFLLNVASNRILRRFQEQYD